MKEGAGHSYVPKEYICASTDEKELESPIKRLINLVSVSPHLTAPAHGERRIVTRRYAN